MYDFLAILQVFSLRENPNSSCSSDSFIDSMPRMETAALSFLTQKLSIELFKLCPIHGIFWIKIIIFSAEYKKFLPLIKG